MHAQLSELRLVQRERLRGRRVRLQSAGRRHLQRLIPISGIEGARGA
jgi:hypothetical protein